MNQKRKEIKMSTENLVREIKPYSTKELANIYDVCDKTMKKWIKPFSEQVGEKNGSSDHGHGYR